MGTVFHAAVQLANPLPYDLDEVEPALAEYKNLDPRWHDWVAVRGVCVQVAMGVFDRVCQSGVSAVAMLVVGQGLG